MHGNFRFFCVLHFILYCTGLDFVRLYCTVQYFLIMNQTGQCPLACAVRGQRKFDRPTNLDLDSNNRPTNLDLDSNNQNNSPNSEADYCYALFP